MKNEQGFTLIETLIAVSLAVILSATGLYGWDSWQQRQRLWQTACQVRDYLVFLRNDANRHNSEHRIALYNDGEKNCLASSAVTGCDSGGPFVMKPMWRGHDKRHNTCAGILRFKRYRVGRTYPGAEPRWWVVGYCLKWRTYQAM